MSLLQRRIAVCFTVVVGIAIFRGVAWHRFLSGYLDSLARVERTHSTLTGFETIVFMLKEAETAERGYLITGKEQQFEHYNTARIRLEQERGRLSEEFSDSPSARAALDHLGPLIDASLASMDEMIAVRRREGFAAAQRLVETDQGTHLMDQLRETARVFGTRERLVLEDQLRGLTSQASQAAGFSIVGTALTIAFIAGWYRLIAGATVRCERELSRQNAALDQLSKLDPLTCLANRRHLDRSLAESFSASVEHGSPLSLVVLDVDGFKGFNDTFGHPAGDEILRQVAAILRDTVREPDLVARSGGEEFAVLLKGVDFEAAVSLAERLRRAIADVDWPLRPVSASFGVATRDASTSDTTQLVSQADRALYHSKSRGRNRVTHYRELIRTAFDSSRAANAADPALNAVCS